MKLTVKGYEVELNGNKMTGDTYHIRKYIKDYLWGTWDAENRAWIVDLNRVEALMNDQYPAIKKVKIVEVETVKSKDNHINGICPKCGTYCYGDCQAH